MTEWTGGSPEVTDGTTARDDEMEKPEGTAWCVFREVSLDAVFDNQEAAQEYADDITARGIAGVLVEPYCLYSDANDLRLRHRG